MQRMRVFAGTLAAGEKRGAGLGSCPLSALSSSPNPTLLTWGMGAVVKDVSHVL